jgi:hypothetical protein
MILDKRDLYPIVISIESSQLSQKKKGGFNIKIQYSYSIIVSNEKPINSVDRFYAQRIMGGAFGA